MEKEKKGWSNQEWDSTGFMVLTLILFGGYLCACWKSPEFRDSELAGDLLLIFSAVLSAMGNHFFNKKPQQNGDTSIR